jgi:hypothetical protein
MVDTYAGIVVNGAFAFGKILETLQWQWFECRPFLLKHGFDLTPGASVNALRRPLGFPVFQEFVLLLN